MNKTCINNQIKYILENKILISIDKLIRDNCGAKIYYNPWVNNHNIFQTIRQTGTTINICVEKKIFSYGKNK